MTFYKEVRLPLFIQDSKCTTPNGQRIPAILICNKADLSRDPRLPGINLPQYLISELLRINNKNLTRHYSSASLFAKMMKLILDDEEISQYVQDEGFVGQWFKTSAKTGDGIQVPSFTHTHTPFCSDFFLANVNKNYS